MIVCCSNTPADRPLDCDDLGQANVAGSDLVDVAERLTMVRRWGSVSIPV